VPAGVDGFAPLAGASRPDLAEDRPPNRGEDLPIGSRHSPMLSLAGAPTHNY